MAQQITNIGDENRETANRVREWRAATDATISQTRDLERDFYFRYKLIKDLVATRVKAKEYQDRRLIVEERVVAAERRLAELQGASTLFQGPQWTDRRE